MVKKLLISSIFPYILSTRNRDKSFQIIIMKASLTNSFFLKSFSLPYFLSFHFSGILFCGQDDQYLHASPKLLTSSKWPFTGPSTEVTKVNTETETLPPALQQAFTAAACLYVVNKWDSYKQTIENQTHST